MGLPQLRLYVPAHTQEALMINPPDSTKTWHKSVLMYPDGSLEKIKIRYRGDNPNNWLFAKKSTRIKTKKKRLIGNRRVFNYIVPESLNQMERYLGFMAANDAGFLSPTARLVEMFVNDDPIGVMIEYARPDEVFLRNSGQMPVNLYKGEQAHIERSEGIDLDLFDSPSLWKKAAVGNDLPKENFSDLSYFLDLTRRAVNDDNAYKKLKLAAPFSVWARFAAYQTLTQNSHNDGYHNQRLITDPWRGEVHPVINDPLFVSHRTDHQMEIDTQSLLRLYNRDASFTLEKYRYLYAFLKKDKLLQRARQRISEQIEPLLISAERDSDIWQEKTWPGFPFKGPSDKLRGALEQYSLEIAQHERWLTEQLEAKPDASWQNSGGRLELRLDKFSPLGDVSIRLREGATLPGRIAWDADGNGKLGPGDIDLPLHFNGQTITLNATWLSNRPAVALNSYRINADYLKVVSKPRATKFSLVADRDLDIVTLKGRNAITGKSFNFKSAIVDGAWPSRLNKPLISQSQPGLQVWDGILTFNGTNFIDYPVMIKPGTTIKMGPEASLIFRQHLNASGTLEAPIIVTPSNPGTPFGLVALQGTGTAGSKLRHFHMDNGGGRRLLNVQYTGMLNLHNTQDITLSGLKLRNSHVSDDMLHIVYSNNVSIENFELTKARSDAIDIDISKNILIKGGVIKDSGNDGIDLMSSTAIVDDTLLSGSKDKGISAGEATEVLVKNSRIELNVNGIVSKDGSSVSAIDTKFIDNKIHLGAYQKNWQYGAGGTIKIKTSKFTGTETVIQADKLSAIQISDSQMSPLVQPGKGVIFNKVSAR